MAQPTLPTWADGDPSYVIEPGSSKKTTGWLSGEKPPYQYMNWIHNATTAYLTYLEDKILSGANAILRSSSAGSWNGSTLTLADPLDISFRVVDGEQLNRLPAGSYAFSDGQVLVVKKDASNASPVTLSSGSYGSLAEGDYVIVTETSLTGDDWENETIILRRKGSDLENVLSGEIYESGSSIDWGKTSLTNASINDASNASVTRVFSATHTTTGTAASGIGTELALLAENDAGSSILVTSLQGVLSTVTSGAEVSNLQFYLTKGGASINPLSLSTTNAYSGGLVFPAPSLQIKGNASQQTAGLMIQSHSSGGNSVMALDSASCTVGQRIASLSYGSRGTDLVSLGIFNETTGSLVYSALCFDSATGFLGIGTESPDVKLEVVRTGTQARLTYTEGSVYSDIETDSSGYLILTTTGGRVNIIGSDTAIASTKRFYFDNFGDTSVGEVSANVINWIAGGSEIMRAGTSVGIGTTGPDAKLDVLSTTEQIRQTYTDGSVYASHLVNSSGYYSVVATGNRYGFGTSSPSTDFHFKGDNSSTAVLRLESNGAFDAALQLTSTNTGSGFVWIYDESANTLALNYDATIGSGAGRWTINSDGELLLPDVDPPTANYANRNSFIQAKGLTHSGGGTSVIGGYNIASCSDDGTGLGTTFWDTDFAAANYTVVAMASGIGFISERTYNAAYMSFNRYDDTGTLTDGSMFVIATGVQ